MLGKGLGNGVPVDAAVGRADLFANMHYGEGSRHLERQPAVAAPPCWPRSTSSKRPTCSAHGRELAKVIEAACCGSPNFDAVAHIRGEGVVWGVECAAVGTTRGRQSPTPASRPAIWATTKAGRSTCSGPLAGKVLRVSPPLMMPLDEAREYLDAMYHLFSRA